VAELLRLEVREFTDLTRWRWVLTDASGAFVTDHEVRLNRAYWQLEAFADLPLYLRWHTAPDRRAADEARTIGEVGEWIGAWVLGAVGAALLERRPAVVHVVVPPEAVSRGAGTLLSRPLELAHVDGKPLSVQDVTLVMELSSGGTTSRGADCAPGVAPVGERLRVLGLFSLPDGPRPLNLRRERQGLVRLIEGIHATGKAADIRVLQYGVTRSALREVLEEAEGWDIIHVSGHGRPGSLLLETPSGRPDRVAGPDLADLLDLARGRVKLVTVSACWSAAVAAGEQRRLLGLPDDYASRDDDNDANDAGAGTISEALATGFARRLGCAVLAMRYPVGDEFAMALTGKLYELLVAEGQPLPRAVGMTLRELSPEGLAAATPALFGAAAADLRLAAPDRLGPANDDTDRLKMTGFPQQPERFVGRTAVMGRASASLAAASGTPGVLLHGMPGGGKTACALELAYGHEHAFDRLVWYKAPDDGTAIDGSLTDFALTLERYLPGFQMADALVPPDRLAAFLPRLGELAKRCRVLIVIDNAESLLAEDGQWRDDRWAGVVGALCGHSGRGRLVLTSRYVPAGLTLTRLEVLEVDVLSADEALLLVRELPHLQALGRGEIPSIDLLTSRRLNRRAIELAQGHPKLLELANGQAAKPGQLARLLAAGDRAWQEQGGLPEGFFATGEAASPAATAADYWHVLATWTREVAEILAPGERDLFWFLCCLEEDDRERALLEGTWARLWNQLGRDRQPPELDQALTTVAARGLASSRGEGGFYAVHPGVAEAGRAQAGKPFRDAVDAVAAAYLDAVYRDAFGGAGEGDVDTGRLVRAGLAAVPYLIRQHQWSDAGAMIGRALGHDPSRANVALAYPAIQQIASRDPGQADVLAAVLEVIDPAAAEAQLRVVLDAVVSQGDYQTASVTAARLTSLCRDSGRLAEALALADQTADYARQAGLGPWTQLNAEVGRLQVLTMMGQASRVLSEVHRLRAHMRTLPDIFRNETTTPWGVRERALEVGRYAAIQLGRWDDALGLNAEQVASMRGRSAPAAAIARATFNDHGPLLSLGRTDEALALLMHCRQVFEDARDIQALGVVISALASAEDRRGHGDAAIRMERDALRYEYLARDVTAIAASYHNLGNWLHRYARQPAAAIASHLTAALIRALAGAAGTHTDSADGAVREAVIDLRAFGAAAIPPPDIADLIRQIGDIPGTDLPGLIAKLSPARVTAEQTLRGLIAQAHELAAAPLSDDQS